MTPETTARLTQRWEALEFNADGNHWTARLRARLTPREERTGLVSVVYGPDADACARETVRQDRLWAEFPLRTNDRETARGRLRYLAGGSDGGAA